MPELPEVETTARALAPLVGTTFDKVVIRNPNLRVRVADDVAYNVAGQELLESTRRAKYLLLRLERGWLVWHLGMSGSIRLNEPQQPLRVHDHIIIHTARRYQLRYHDPRRFGSLVYCNHPPEQLPALARLGPEPLGEAGSTNSTSDNGKSGEGGFTPGYLFAASRGKRISIKQLIMDGKVVVGVGNIYATEALFVAGIDPRLAACRLTRNQAQRLVTSIQQILTQAIAAGGTTLRDFVHSYSKPGYFQQSLRVYGREGQACLVCTSSIKSEVIAQRSSYWCPVCQKKRNTRQTQ